MNSPPVEKRGGNLAATTPNGFNFYADDTPLVCGAQTSWCEHHNTRIEQLANGPHHAKEICSDCGQLLRWVAKPETIDRQQFNSFRITKLAMTVGLSPWEREFIKSIGQFKKLSPKQLTKLDELCEKFQIGVRQ